MNTSSESSDQLRRTRPGGRTALVRRSVLDATIAELADSGFAALSFDRVASRAGVHRTTLYRRWETREALIADALLEQTSRDVPMPDTGSTEKDFEQLATSIAANLGDPNTERILRTLLSDAVFNPAIAHAAERFWATRFALVGDVIQRGIDRGELPPRLDVTALIEALAGPLYFRVLVTGAPIDSAYAVANARRTFHAARAGVFDTPQP
ncbi:MAG TPA: TetR family transcriptional regulator [Gordonia polyisoprenivorans]|uniref:TetR/AcrR family transcriptional regulator n=1 Tax=Gordonia polyisoprenivorans TaxID=84595 RepID=UPI000B99EA80|nr:TetR/AcrR family transcriptional regulator [Gordonia polyisoprenivorans]OZC31204.1 hypothetical protein CJJ17_06745 [Gordonia polyisoprenivorans]HCS56436.1 TetR family transcriptional regulator [Gordonia polyisoprenivorans]